MDFLLYGSLLVEVNTCSSGGMAGWLFVDGMGFRDEDVWWPSTWEKRLVPHEGLDLVKFTRKNGEQELFAGFRIITPVSGVVVSVCDDFLDKTVWINPDGQPHNLVLLCHIEPSVVVGQRLICGDPVGVISYRVTNVPLHLHLSVLTGQWQLIKCLTWDGVHDQSHAEFIYPSF